MNKPFYLIVDSTHPDFPYAEGEADVAQSKFVSPNSNLSVRWSLDGTKAMTKIVGNGTEWYQNSVWYGHPMILDVFTHNEYDGFKNFSELVTVLKSAEWREQTEGEPTGSPIE